MEITTRAEAIEQGLSVYNNGSPCAHGHVAGRYTASGRCLVCNKQKLKEYRDKKKSERRASGVLRLKEAEAMGLEFYDNGKACKHGNYGKRKTSSKGKCYCPPCYEEHKKICRDAATKKRRALGRKPIRRVTQEESKARYDKWVANNRERLNQYQQNWREANRERLNQYQRNWREANGDRMRPYQSAYNAIRRQRTSMPLSKLHLDAIVRVYEKRDEVIRATGIDHHVDHIVPLLGKNVCGLHVPWNLQVIPATDNLRKSNKWEGSK